MIDLGADRLLTKGKTLLLDVGKDFETYHWSTGEQERQIVVHDTGHYSVEVIDRFGCKANARIYIGPDTLPVSGGKPFVIYPNPGKDRFYIDIRDQVEGDYDLRLYTTEGRLVYRESLQVSSGLQTFSIQPHQLPSGNYLLQLKGPETTFVDRLSIRH